MSDLFELHKKYDSIKVRPKYKNTTQHFITEVYPLYLGAKREKIETLLEIGVYKGGSVLAMRDYFPSAKIVGMDISFDLLSWKEDLPPNVVLEQGDQEDKEFLKKVGDSHGPFDFIIDDGGHQFKQQKSSFDILWYYVKPGGYYFIEDVRKGCNGYLIFEYILDNFATGDRFVNYRISKRFGVEHEIASVAFYRGILVLTKAWADEALPDH
jgi:hypothetical protein